jgi:hypothetical protein
MNRLANNIAELSAFKMDMRSMNATTRDTSSSDTVSTTIGVTKNGTGKKLEGGMVEGVEDGTQDNGVSVVTVTPTTTHPSVFSLQMPSRMLINTNRALFLVHLTMAVLTLSIGDLDYAPPLYVDTFISDRDASGWQLGLGLPVRYVQARITFMTALFFATTAVFHLCAAQVWPTYYIENLARCRNPSRWVEYGITAPIMAFCIAYFCGCLGWLQILGIFGLTQTTMLFGYLSEELVRPISAEEYKYPLYVDRMSAHAMGYLPQVYCWTIILWQFFDATSRSETRDEFGNEREMPSWVYALVIIEVLFFWSFGFVQLWQLSQPPRLYVRGEFMYMALSATSKVVLGVFLLANALTASN